MKNTVGAVVGLCMIAACAGAAAQGARIAVVDTRRIQAESVPFVRANEALKREFASREQEILAFQKQINAERARFDKEQAKLAPEERQRRANALTNSMKKSDQMAIALAEDIERRKREVMGSLIDDADAAVKAVAEAGKFDLVLREAVYFSRAIDITDRVLKEMARRSGGKP